MTGAEALAELLDRLGAEKDGAVFIDELELRRWPATAVNAMKAGGLLSAAPDAGSVICRGCERQCHMLVEIVGEAGRSAAFVVCDKRDDINRVAVPLESLERWQVSGEAVAAFLAKALSINRPSGTTFQRGRWEVGILRSKRSGQVTLKSANRLTLELAGHAVPLVDVVSLKGGRLQVQRQRLIDCVDHPAAGGGTRESGADRRGRIVARCAVLKTQGFQNFRVIVAREENCSVETIKKILAKSKSS